MQTTYANASAIRKALRILALMIACETDSAIRQGLERARVEILSWS